MFLSPCRRANRVIRSLAPACAMTLLFVVPAVTAGADEAETVLTGVEVAPEGRLLRVTFRATGPLERFVLTRQGPPNDRDLVLDLQGVVSGMSLPPTDSSGEGSEARYQISPIDAEGGRALRVVLDRAGDSLVRLDHGAGSLSLVIIPPEGGRVRSADAYRIGADDVLAISVFGHDDLSKTMKVSPDGLINYPLIGNVKASGRSVDEVAGEIQEKLATNYLVDPHVTVSVWEYLSQWVNVIGAVIKPGRYYMTGPMTVIDAVSQAGGATPSAGDVIQVTRRAMESDPSAAGEVITISASSILSPNGGSAVMRLRPGDVVNVLSRESTPAGR